LKEHKKVKLEFEGEALDPSELFDQQGNIQMNNLIFQNEVNNSPKEENSLMEPVSYESYRLDAAILDSDDSFDTFELSHTKEDLC